MDERRRSYGEENLKRFCRLCNGRLFANDFRSYSAVFKSREDSIKFQRLLDLVNIYNTLLSSNSETNFFRIECYLTKGSAYYYEILDPLLAKETLVCNDPDKEIIIEDLSGDLITSYEQLSVMSKCYSISKRVTITPAKEPTFRLWKLIIPE